MASLPEHLMPLPVGREQLPREVLADHQRERVLAAAREVFAKRGYQASTVDHIVSAARIGVGSFYSLFGGKQECFLDLYDQVLAESRQRLGEVVPADRPWPERIATALATVLHLIEADPFAARIAFVEVHAAGPAALALHSRNLDEAAVALREGREHSPVAEELPARLELATVGGLAWFLQQRIVAGEANHACAWLTEVLEITVEPYLGESAVAELAGQA